MTLPRLIDMPHASATQGGSVSSLLDGYVNSTAPYRARFDQHHIGSVFQPIFTLAGQGVVGYEGLLRAQRPLGINIPPPQLFAGQHDSAAVIDLDRLCRTLHVGNFSAQGLEGWLFLNINPRVVVEGRLRSTFFAELLQRFALPPERIVVEILESAIDDEAALAEAVDYYKDLNCLVAIDDFGAGHSNFERIMRLQPDIVKLDRSLLANADTLRTRRILPNLVTLLHEADCIVVQEGINSEEDALRAMEANVDLVQGYYFARPNPQPDTQPSNTTATRFAQLQQSFRLQQAQQLSDHWELLSTYQQALRDAAQALSRGYGFTSSVIPLDTLPDILGSYLLDSNGRRRHSRPGCQPTQRSGDPRYAPLELPGEGVECSMKPGFRSAMAAPGQLQTIPAQLSLYGALPCTTLAITVATADGPGVLCCDIARE